MSDNQQDNSQLQRHTAALRDQPVPEGPPAQTIAATLAMLESTESNSAASEKSFVTQRWGFLERILPMTFAKRIAAAVLIAVGALILYFVFNATSASVAFADVAAKLKAARTLAYTTAVTIPPNPPTTMKILMSDPDRVRTEMPDGTVMIHGAGSSLILSPVARTANRMNYTGVAGHEVQAHSEVNMVEAMKSLGDSKGESVGEKTFEGVVATGFRTKLAGNTATIWADKKTALPVRIEMTMSIGSIESVMVMDHFQIDPPLEDSLFSLDPPAGYTLTNQTLTLPKFGSLDEEVAKLLGDYAKLSNGNLPPSLTDWSAFISAQSKATPDNQNQLAMRVGGISGMLFSLPEGYGYAGKGVKLGEENKIVFWYHPKAKSPTYRAVFADLHIADVTADKLPATQPSQP